MRKKILLVDDELDIVEIMAEAFQSQGFETQFALSGNEAIELLKNQDFDYVLSDYKMPNGNGFKLLNFIQTLDNKPKFFFLSGQADLSPNECKEAGALEFFMKPFDIEDMIQQINSF